MNNFWVKLGAVAVVILGLYYAMSPYQKCMRGVESWSDYIAKHPTFNFTEEQKRIRNSSIVSSCQRYNSW